MKFDDFLRYADAAYPNGYRYDRTDWRGLNEPALIECVEHGVFSKTPHAFLYYTGCPMCLHNGAETGRPGRRPVAKRRSKKVYKMYIMESIGALYVSHNNRLGTVLHEFEIIGQKKYWYIVRLLRIDYHRTAKYVIDMGLYMRVYEFLRFECDREIL